MAMLDIVSEQLQVCCAFLPPWMSAYARLHLDTISKIMTHLLLLMAVCNFFLFLVSFRSLVLPDMGYNTVLGAFLLCCQTATVYTVLNNSRIGGFSMLEPSEFIVGVCFGISVGGTIVAYMITNFYRSVPDRTCNDSNMDQTINEYICGDIKKGLTDISFWSGLVFWWNVCLSFLIAMGRQELTQMGQTIQYDNLSMETDASYGNHVVPNYQQQAATPDGTFAGGMMGQQVQQPFVGDYSSVPEIRDTNNPAANTTAL